MSSRAIWRPCGKDGLTFAIPTFPPVSPCRYMSTCDLLIVTTFRTGNVIALKTINLYYVKFKYYGRFIIIINLEIGRSCTKKRLKLKNLIRLVYSLTGLILCVTFPVELKWHVRTLSWLTYLYFLFISVERVLNSSAWRGQSLTFYRKQMFPFRKKQIFHFVSFHFVSQSTDFSFRFVPFRFAEHRFFISFRPISFRPISFRPISFRPISFRPISFRPISFRPISFRPISFRPISFRPISFRPISFRPISFCPISFRPISFRPISFRPISFRPISFRPISFRKVQ